MKRRYVVATIGGGPAGSPIVPLLQSGRLILSFSLGLAVLLMAGCASPDPAFIPSQSASALVRWQRSDSSLVCDAVFARSADGGAMAHIYKTSAKPLLLLTLNSQGRLHASGPLAGLGWAGPSAEAPVPLSTWAKIMEIYRVTGSWPDGTREIHGAGTRAILTITRHELASLAVTNDLNGETITVRFRAPEN